jgi:ribosomal protein L40E
MGDISICMHCHNSVPGSAKFCGDCNTSDKRRAMDEANRKLFKTMGLDYKCHHCDRKGKVEDLSNKE